MCWEDVKIGRASSAVKSLVTLTEDSQAMLCGVDNNRTRLNLSIGLNSGVTISAGESAAMTVFVASMTPESPNLTLRLEDWGEMIRWSFFAYNQTGGSVISVVQVGIKEKP